MYSYIWLFLSCVILSLSRSSVTCEESMVDRNDGLTTDLQKSMIPFFFLPSNFMRAVQPNSKEVLTYIPELNNEDDFITFENNARNFKFWQSHIDYYSGYLACLVVGAVLVIGTLLASLVVCCCRCCCGTCGGGTDRQLPAHASRKRACCGFWMLITLLSMIVALVCCFICSQLLYEEIRDSNSGAMHDVSTSMQTIDNFNNRLEKDLRATIVDSYDESQSQIFNKLDKFPDHLVGKVNEITNAGTLLNEAKQLAEDLVPVEEAINKAIESANNLKTGKDTVIEQLMTIRDDIVSGIEACTDSECNRVRELAETIGTALNTVNLPVLSELVEQIGDVSDANIVENIQKGIEQYYTIKDEVEEHVHKRTADAKKAGRELRATVVKALKLFSNTTNQMTLGKYQADVANYSEELSDNSMYIYIGCMVVSSLLVLIVALYLVGLACGVCGEPNYEDAGCCNKGAGANCLVAGMAFTLLLGWLLMLLVMILFIAGGGLYAEVCLNLEDPPRSDLFTVASNLAAKELKERNAFDAKGEIDVNLGQFLLNCHENMPLYKAANIEQFYDIQEYFDVSELRKTLDDVVRDINLEDVASQLEIMSPEMKKQLRELADIDIESRIKPYIDEIQKKLTKESLSDLASEIEKFSREVSSLEHKRVLREASEEIYKIDKKEIPQLQKTLEELKEAVDTVKNHISLASTAQMIANGLIKAQEQLVDKLEDIVKQSVRDIGNEVTDMASDYVQSVTHNLETSTAPCEPVSDAYVMAVSAACHKILYPLNMFWFSLAWFVVFALIAVFFAAYLSWLYRKDEKYIKYLVSADEHGQTYTPSQRSRSAYTSP